MFENIAILAQAQAPAEGSGGGGMMVLVGYVAIFGVMIFFMFRNQKKQAKKREQMIESLKVGDKVITGGGIYGEIAKIKEKTMMVRIADNAVVELNKSGVGTVLGQEAEQEGK